MTQSIPKLSTLVSGPLQHFERTALERQADIEQWFRHQWLQTPAPFYASVDLRNAGYKLAPVDTNLFPAGFNNLSPAFEPLCIAALQAAVERVCPHAKSVLLIPENHTRNQFYLRNVARLMDLMRKAGFSVRIGSLMDDITEPTTLTLDGGEELLLEPLVRDGDTLGVEGFSPCAILLNNDLSSGRPAILDGLSQPVMPPLDLGWGKRTKSEHFGVYKQVAHEFGDELDIDPWLVDPLFRNCGEINFKTREGEDCLASNVDALITAIQAKYDKYGIDKRPYVIVKSDSGTYGMGIMTAHSADDVRGLNRKQRNKMASGKEGNAVTGAIIQEGVYTTEQWGPKKSPAESVVYMIDRSVVGAFYRVHADKSEDTSLNSPGAEFHPLEFADAASRPDPSLEPDAAPNRFYAYGVTARLALVAAAREIDKAAR